MSPKTAFRGQLRDRKTSVGHFHLADYTNAAKKSFWFCFQCHNSRNAINHFAVCIRVLTLGTYVWLLWIFKWKIFSLKLHFSSLNKFVDRRSNLACRPAWKRCVSCLWMTVKLWFWAWKRCDICQEHEGYQCSTCTLWFYQVKISGRKQDQEGCCRVRSYLIIYHSWPATLWLISWSSPLKCQGAKVWPISSPASKTQIVNIQQ